MKFRSPVFSDEKILRINKTGGIVTSQHGSFISNDRLSDGENIWNKNGILSSRPGLAVTKNGILSEYSFPYDLEKVFYADFPFDGVAGYNRLGAIVKESYYVYTDIDFFVVDSKGNSRYLTHLEFVGATEKIVFEIKNILFVKSTPIKGCGIFVLIPIRRYDATTDADTKFVNYYELSTNYKNLISLDPSVFYRPLILKHGFGNAVPVEITKTRSTSYPEGVNILGGNFEACFTTDGNSYYFRLPTSIDQDAPVEIRLYTSGTVYLTFKIPVNSTSSQTLSLMQKDITAYINRSTGELFFYTGSETYGVPSLISNHALRVYSRADTSAAAYELLSRNTRPISFDNRLFFPGGENRGNKIYYSGKNQPLYYCEKNYIPVGDNNYDITALSLQNRYVIAFKERELYRLSLTESAEQDRNELLYDNSISEMPTPSCKTTRINDSIGCDLPATIVNCANRLVWFHSDGSVYTLYGSNLYTDGSIYELSGDISDKLRNFSKDNLDRIFAAELNGFYVLGVDDRLFIMDTRVSGFRYLSGHKAANKDYGGLPWFIWKAPEDTCFISAFLCGGNEYFIMRTRYDYIFYIASPDNEKDIVPTDDGGKTESLPQFSLSTAVLGDSLMYADRVNISASAKNPLTVEVYDENGVFKTANTSGGERLKSLTLPLHYKKGGVGITLKGSGQFYLKDISLSFSKRKY